MLPKMDFMVQMNPKSGQLKNESKSELFRAPGRPQKTENGISINAFEVCLMVQIRVYLIIQLEFHLKVHFKIYIKMLKKVHLGIH